MIEEEIDYVRYATFATLRSLRYATLRYRQERTEGRTTRVFLVVSDREREGEREKAEEKKRGQTRYT